MRMTSQELARMVDLSLVRTDITLADVHALAAAAKKYRCICTFVMPSYLSEMRKLLADAPEVGVGGVVGFPSGAHSTATKVAEAREQHAQGATELDMVLNVGMLRSGCDSYVMNDIQSAVKAVPGIPVKVILEAHYLNEEEIRRACRLAVDAGAAFVKTGTGWAPTGATLENVQIMKSAVGDRAKIKAAGGISDLKTVAAMIALGVSRFGVSLRSGIALLDQCAALPAGLEIPAADSSPSIVVSAQS
jgi:deoxyribose-phosphate aldolase